MKKSAALFLAALSAVVSRKRSAGNDGKISEDRRNTYTSSLILGKGQMGDEIKKKDGSKERIKFVVN